MEKLFGIIGKIVKALLPVAEDLVRAVFGVAGKHSKKLTKAAAPVVRKVIDRRTRGLKKKARKVLRSTALISGLVCAASIAGIALTHKK